MNLCDFMIGNKVIFLPLVKNESAADCDSATEEVGLLCYHPTVAGRAAGKNSISLPSARLRTT